MSLFARSPRPLGIAVVGLGHIAQNAVLPAFSHTRRACLAALVSSDEHKREVLGRRYRVSRTYAYDGYDRCLADPNVDAVYIALPNTQHRAYAERAARAGKHVLCEKPMAPTAGDCVAMTNAAHEHDVRLMIAYRLHFDPANLHVVDAIGNGAIGTPKYMHAEFSYQLRPGNIRTQPELGGGALWDIGIYCVNAARYVFQDEPVEVFAYGMDNRMDPRFAHVEEGASVLMRFAGDRTASFTCSFGSATAGEYRVVGTEGDIRLANAFEYEGDRTLYVTRADEKTHATTFRQTDQFAAEIDYFAGCVAGRREPEPSGEEGLADVRIIEAVYESIERRAPVRLAPFDRNERPEIAQSIRRPAAREPKLVGVQPPTT